MVDDEGKREEVMAELLKNLDPSEQRVSTSGGLEGIQPAMGGKKSTCL